MYNRNDSASAPLVSAWEVDEAAVGDKKRDSGSTGQATLHIHVKCDKAVMEEDVPSYMYKAKTVVPETHYAPVESLNYDLSENVVFRAQQANRTPTDLLIYSCLKWLLCLMTAVIVAGFGILVNLGVENLAGTKFYWTLSIMEDSYFLSFCVYATFNCFLVFCASCLVVYWGPAAAGSGIPDVKAYLNGVNIPGVFALRTLITKVVGCICAVAGGLAVGKEGPFVHLGSCIASLLTEGGPPGFRIRNKWLRMIQNDKDRRDMVTCGGTAGVAGAFRSPVGGVLFALEEASSWWSQSLLWRAFFTTAVVSVSLRMMIKACGGSNCGYFGSGGYIIFEISMGQVDYQLMELFPMLLLGLLGGVLGSTFNSLNAQLCIWRRDVLGKYGPSYKIAEAVLVTFIASLISFGLPLLAACRKCPANTPSCPRSHDADFGSYIPFNCPNPDEYNDLATLFFNTQDNAIRSLFSSNTGHEYSVSTLTIFFLFFYALSILTYGVAVPSGLFVPCILCGASYGRLVGMFMTEMSGGQDIDEGTYALLGAASFLGGSMRMTVSLCVILLELTNNLNLLPLIMLVLLVSKAVGDCTGIHPVYDIHIDLKRLPFLGAKAPHFMRHLKAAEAATPNPVSLPRIVRVDSILQTLMMTDVNGFPVFDQTKGDEFKGIILRSQLVALLHNPRCFLKSPEPALPEISLYMSTDLVNDSSESVSDLQHTEEQLLSYLDLGPVCNPSTYVIQEGASLSKVYAQFRQLELRHMVVIPKVSAISGILTRKDLLPGMLEKRFPEMMSGISKPSQGLIRRTSQETSSSSSPRLGGGLARKSSLPSGASIHIRKPSLVQ
mmetsp:Transcript_33733/g.86204  ORF Transcript_33733/g.86204 Transcript_33733/m.86204 type:complete len:833 (-) Transcript_33733:225-2723(-)|eukprot:jgi/Tetstr1/446633/TSEL_034156.t1